MRPRSGALHCQTQQELFQVPISNNNLQLASNNQLGKFYTQPYQSTTTNFQQIKFQSEWNIDEAQSFKEITQDSTQPSILKTSQEEISEEEAQVEELTRGKRHLGCCIVDEELIRCTIEIGIVTDKVSETISRIVDKDSIVNLFTHEKDAQKQQKDGHGGQKGKCIYGHASIISQKNSNVFIIETHDDEQCNAHMEKQKEDKKPTQNKAKLSPKNWLKNNRNESMMELLIVKKHIFISQQSQVGRRKITLIYRIFILNEKYINNPLIKIYLKKCQYVVDMEIQNRDNYSEVTEGGQKKRKSDRLFISRSSALYEKQCQIYDKGEFIETIREKKLSEPEIKRESSLTTTNSETMSERSNSQNCQNFKQILEEKNPEPNTKPIVKFKNAFHRVQERVAKNYMKKLNEILVREKMEKINEKN